MDLDVLRYRNLRYNHKIKCILKFLIITIIILVLVFFIIYFIDEVKIIAFIQFFAIITAYSAVFSQIYRDNMNREKDYYDAFCYLKKLIDNIYENRKELKNNQFYQRQIIFNLGLIRDWYKKALQRFHIFISKDPNPDYMFINSREISYRINNKGIFKSDINEDWVEITGNRKEQIQLLDVLYHRI